jgi:hypothetical protein
MDRKIRSLRPDYKRIYSDIINLKYPEKRDECKTLLNKVSLSTLDIIQLNRKIFGIHTNKINQKHCSYQRADILQILDYQKKYKINNTQLANHFKISRNTVTRWRKLF